MAEQTGQGKPEGPQRWVWSAMEPDERESRLAELTLWVDWLIETYDVRNQIARCWYRHPRIIEQLTALYLGWVRTYAGDPSKLTLRAEIDWVKELYAFLPRLGNASCQSSHQDPPAPPLTDGEAYSEWVDAGPAFLARPRSHPAQAQVFRLAEGARAAAEARSGG
ncbi:hypothetical protein [Streptomyces spirodelae]|uniref:Uncharacterized protein n=1 Tax=Streptomyces spirodelae TaxID=2812904 RepID=A0ABS3X3F7_9ACTN|nr:hypothetical protein [Streptomyces spirodelae]MBO8189895.1 hypothetical protein [Streptomyces spirodelae]